MQYIYVSNGTENGTLKARFDLTTVDRKKFDALENDAVELKSCKK